MDQLLSSKFQRTDRGASLQTLKVASWNVELTHHFAGDEALESLQVLLLQEVITEEGRSFHEHNSWILLYGKNQGDWRGTGMAYRTSQATHSNTTLLLGGLATTLTSKTGARGIRFLTGHIPHHATIAQTEAYLQAWGPTLCKTRVVLGMDANETFTDTDGEGWRAHTGREEVVLGELRLPKNWPSTHTTHTTRHSAPEGWTTSPSGGCAQQQGGRRGKQTHGEI